MSTDSVIVPGHLDGQQSSPAAPHNPAAMHSPAGPHGFEVRSVHMTDPLVRPLLDDLERTYLRLYASLLGEEVLREEMAHYAPEEFVAPDGDFVLVLEDGVPVAGGAFRLSVEPELGDPSLSRYPDAPRGTDGRTVTATAELKRIWTHADHRRRGLARIVLAELEDRAAAAGYGRIYLTTGSRQPEAAALYLRTGYTALYDTDAAWTDADGPLAFEKWMLPPV